VESDEVSKECYLVCKKAEEAAKIASKENFQKNVTEDLLVEGERLSFVCPLSKARISIPVKGIRCKHGQCFDEKAFVSCKTMFSCPVCGKWILSQEELERDHNFEELLHNAPDTASFVEMLSGKPNYVVEQYSCPTPKILPVEIIDVDTLDIEQDLSVSHITHTLRFEIESSNINSEAISNDWQQALNAEMKSLISLVKKSNSNNNEKNRIRVITKIELLADKTSSL